MEIMYPAKNYTVWDLETSGLDPFTDKITEIGYLTVRDGVVTEQASMLLDHPGFEIPQKIVEITGITTEMCRAEGMEPEAAYEILLSKLDKHAHVTHNGLRFDLEFLLNAIGKKMPLYLWEPISYQMYKGAIDTAVLFKAKKLERRQRFSESFRDWGNRVMDERVAGLKFNVGFCCDDLGIDRSSITQHRALGDVQLTHEIYKKLCL